MGFISDLLTNISAFRIKVGEKLNWLNANKADTTALADFVKKDGSVVMTGNLKVPAIEFPAVGGVQDRNFYLQPRASVLGDFAIYSTDYQGNNPMYSLFYISPLGRIGLGTDHPQAELHVNGNVIVDDIVTIVTGNSYLWFQAYNERVIQFNTAYTTSVYTFSVVLANGVQKQTTLQVNSSHFVINGSGVLQLNAAIAQKISDAVTAADVSSMGYQTVTQVQSEVTNQIADLGFAPNPHRYIPITANSTVIDPSQHRRIVAVFENPSVLVAVLPNNAFPGTVVTLQTTGTSVTVTMDFRKPASSGSSLLIEPNRSVQMSFSEDQSAWIIEQYNILS